MQGRLIVGALLLLGLVVFPLTCPAPVIYRPGEGWTYEAVGSSGARWERKRAKDQLQVAQEAFDRGDYRLATKAANRVVKVWPLSDYAGRAQYLIGRSYEARKMDERAFKSYQTALTKYPKIDNYDEVLVRQYAIAGRFLDGQRFRLFGYIPLFRSMERTAAMMQKVVANGPFYSTGPKAQLDTGTAQEKDKNYPLAVKAYEQAADRYFDRPPVASEAIYRAGKAWEKQALRGEYDQSKAGSSIALMQDFIELYPKNPQVPDANKTISVLRVEQARGAFETGRFYERYKRWQAALVYYNDSIQKDSTSPYADEARRRIELLRPLAEAQVKKLAEFELKVRQRSSARATNAVPLRLPKDAPGLLPVPMTNNPASPTESGDSQKDSRP